MKNTIILTNIKDKLKCNYLDKNRKFVTIYLDVKKLIYLKYYTILLTCQRVNDDIFYRED